MGFRKFKADQLFTGYQLLDNSQVLITDEKGKVEAIKPLPEAGEGIESFHGILTPGFINCHCHLELSHLKNVIPPYTGLIDFLCSVVTKRDFPSSVIRQEIEKAEQEMYFNGIVAVGDICNTSDALETKSRSSLRWHSFIEVLSFTDENARKNITHYEKVLDEHREKLRAPNRSVLTPHAPYSISPLTFELINSVTSRQIISIHNQEHPAEDELYRAGGGDFLRLFKIFGVNSSPFPVTGRSSIASYLPHFNNYQTLLLIHDTYMVHEDIVFANRYASQNNLSLVYCLCPNANLYIENKMPPVDQFLDQNCQLVLGTDSYSSNWELSIAKEIQAIHLHFPLIPLEIILQWATINGAKALHWNDQLGSFEKGKQPGITLLHNDLNSSKKIL